MLGSASWVISTSNSSNGVMQCVIILDISNLFYGFVSSQRVDSISALACEIRLFGGNYIH